MRLLIVGMLAGHLTTAGKIAMGRGAHVVHAETVDQALTALRDGRGADLVMVDVMLDVGRLCDSLVSERILVPVVACGVASDARAAVRAIQAGAREYVPLPPDAALIAAVLEAVVADSHQLLSRDARMLRVLRLADQVAASDASVLVSGESGTGKELMARYLHRKSRRAEKPFVSVNCAAIPETLLESELFGHEKGAFTGAVARRLGKFEEANGGTLLLDEISEMDPRLQAKLLRAIQEREIDRLGGSKPVKVNIRLICTTNRDMEAQVRAGAFREDLFYRINVVGVAIPPLRQRPADIPFLADHFVARFAEENGLTENGLSGRRLTERAHAKLARHAWRGNVRELENTLHRAVLLSEGTMIDAEDLGLTGAPAADDLAFEAASLAADPPAAPASPVPPVAPAPPAADAAADDADAGTAALVGRTVAEVERDLILKTLQHTFGNRTHAATILGISIRTLRNKLKQYGDEGIAVPAPGEPERACL